MYDRQFERELSIINDLLLGYSSKFSHLLDNADQVGGVGQVPEVEDEVAVLHVGVLVDVVDAVGVEQRGTAFDAVDDITFFEQEFGEIGAVLAGDTGD